MNSPLDQEGIGPSLRPALFFDRDGVVNVSPGAGFVERWEDFSFQPGIGDVLREGKKCGFCNVLISNQRAVSLGKISDRELAVIHERMQAVLEAEKAAFEGLYVAVGDRSDPRRKPAPTMVEEAVDELGLDLNRSVFVGDDPRDMECARNAGVAVAVQLLGEKPESPLADVVVSSVEELKEWFDKMSVSILQR